MKTILNILIIILLGALYSCSQKDDYSPSELGYTPQDTISVNFSFYSAQQGVVETKTPLSINATTISNLNIYVFNELGAVVAHKYVTGVTQVSNIVIDKSNKYTVYAIANAGVSLPCTKATEVEELSVKITNIEELVDGVGAVLMSGKSSLITLNDGTNVDIELTRCISKLSLAFDYSELSSGVSINIKRAQLFNAPSSIKLFNENKAVEGDVIEGEFYEQSHLSAFSSTTNGVTSNSFIPFYLFENMQGVVAVGALDNKNKEQSMSEDAKMNSSYIEMEYDYSSNEKRGTIIYRFYIGERHSDCNILRNTNYLCTVYFKGNGSADENSWSVDNSALIDLVTSITLNPTSYEFSMLGDTKQITATILPLTAEDKTISWSSSNTAVATVSNSGLVTSINDGTAIITATSTDGTNISAICNIVVDSKIAVTSVTVTPSTLSLYEGDNSTIVAKILPSDASYPTINWSSSNTDIATVDDNGTVIAIAKGEVDITASSVDDPTKKGVCKLTVSEKELEITPLSKTLYVGESFNITYKVNPPTTPTFISSAPNVATVDASGKVVAISEGTTNITVSANGLSEVCKITVVQPILEFAGSRCEIYQEEEVIIQFSRLVPSDEIPTVLSSSSSIVEILEVTDTGVKVRGVGLGTAVLTASTHGVTDTYSITVTPLEIEIYTIYAQDGAEILLDSEYFNGKSNYNQYGVRAVRDGAVVEFDNILWSADALLSNQLSENILRVYTSTSQIFTAQATVLNNTTQSQRGKIVIKATVTTKAGVVCNAMQQLQVFEYAPIWLTWSTNDTSGYSSIVDGYVYPIISKDGKNMDSRYNSPSIIVVPNIDEIITTPIVATIQSGSLDFYLPWSQINTSGDWEIFYPKTVEDFATYNVGSLNIWDTDYSLYYVYQGNVMP